MVIEQTANSGARFLADTGNIWRVLGETAGKGYLAVIREGILGRDQTAPLCDAGVIYCWHPQALANMTRLA